MLVYRSEYYCRAVYVDKKPDSLGGSLDERAECVVDGDRKPFVEGMAPLCASLQDVDGGNIFADWAARPPSPFFNLARGDSPTAGSSHLRHHVRDLGDPGRRARHAPQHDRLRRPAGAPHRRVEGQASSELTLGARFKVGVGLGRLGHKIATRADFPLLASWAHDCTARALDDAHAVAPAPRRSSADRRLIRARLVGSRSWWPRSARSRGRPGRCPPFRGANKRRRVRR